MNNFAVNKWRKLNWADAIAYLLIFLFIVTFAWMGWLRHASFNSSAFDLGIYDQVVWNTLHGRIYFYTTTGLPLLHLSNHADPSLIFVAPFYLLHSGPETLIFLQAIVIGLGGLPIFWLARQLLKNDFAALSLLIAYLSFPSLQVVPLWDFHPPALATGLLLFAFYFLVRKRYAWFFVFAAISMGLKEQIPLVVMFMGLYIIIAQRKWRIGLATIIGAGLYFFVIMYWVIPANSVVGEHLFLGYYADLGHSPAQIILTALTRPDIVWANLWQPEKLAYLKDIFAPFAFLPLFGLPVLLIGAPSLAINLLSSNAAMHDATQAQYISTLAPWLAMGAVYGLYFLNQGLKRWLPHAQKWGLPILSLLLIIVASVAHIERGYSPLSLNHSNWEITAHDKLAQRFIDQIPADAPLSAQGKLYPHLSNRITAYQFPDVNDADYIFLDVTVSSWPIHPNDLKADFERILADGDFGILDAADGYILLKRGIKNSTLPNNFYSFARAENPNPQYPLDVIFGDSLRLLGYDVLDLTNERGGREISVRWYWQALKSIDDGSRVYPFFVDAENRVTEDTALRPLVAQNWYPPQQWRTDETIITETIPWDVGNPWSLGVGVLRGETWSDWTQRLPVTQNNTLGVRAFDANTWLRVGTFERQNRRVEKLGTADVNANLAPQRPLKANFADQIRLLGYDISQQDNTLDLTFYWQAYAPLPLDYSVFVHLIAPDGTRIAQHDGQPTWQAPIPTSTWLPAEIIRDRHTLSLPKNTPAGKYTLHVGLYYWETLENLPVLENGTPVSEFASIEIELN